MTVNTSKNYESSFTASFHCNKLEKTWWGWSRGVSSLLPSCLWEECWRSRCNDGCRFCERARCRQQAPVSMFDGWCWAWQEREMPFSHSKTNNICKTTQHVEKQDKECLNFLRERERERERERPSGSLAPEWSHSLIAMCPQVKVFRLVAVDGDVPNR